jgi:hypothetical protein
VLLMVGLLVFGLLINLEGWHWWCDEPWSLS